MRWAGLSTRQAWVGWNTFVERRYTARRMPTVSVVYMACSPARRGGTSVRNARAHAHVCAYNCTRVYRRVRADAIRRHDLRALAHTHAHAHAHTYRLDLGQVVGLGTGEQQVVRAHPREEDALCCHPHRRRIDKVGCGLDGESFVAVIADAHGERREALATDARIHFVRGGPGRSNDAGRTVDQWGTSRGSHVTHAQAGHGWSEGRYHAPSTCGRAFCGALGRLWGADPGNLPCSVL